MSDYQLSDDKEAGSGCRHDPSSARLGKTVQQLHRPHDTPPASISTSPSPSTSPYPSLSPTALRLDTRTRLGTDPLPTADRASLADRLYRPLSSLASWETRVLALHSAQRGQVLTGDLHRAVITHTNGLGLVSEDRNEEYEALSYTWGSQRFTHTLICNGIALSITSNLHEALQRLRRKNVERFIWVDALCINQFDNHERARQIRNLFVIFKRARRVVVWLGRATRNTKAAIDFATVLTRLVYKPEPDLPRYKWWHESEARHEAKQILKQYDQLTVLNILQGLQDLAKRAWMRRAWVVQEVHAASSIRIKCGPYSVRWRAWTQLHHSLDAVIWFIEAQRQKLQTSPAASYFALPVRRNPGRSNLHLMNSMRRNIQSGSEADTADDSDLDLSASEPDSAAVVRELWPHRHEEIDAIRNVMDFLTSYGPGHEAAPRTIPAHRTLISTFEQRKQHNSLAAARELNTILLQSGHLCAVDDRDRVFALLGLTHVPISYGNESNFGGIGINVNYDRSASEVYQNVTRYFMQKCQHLGVLYYKWASDDEEDGSANGDIALPSWTPDWRNINHKSFLAAMPPPLQHPWDLMTSDTLEQHLSCLYDKPKFHFDRAMRSQVPHWPGTYFVATPELTGSGVLRLTGRSIGLISRVEIKEGTASEDRHPIVNIMLHHSGFMNYCIMSKKAHHALPSYAPRPGSPSPAQPRQTAVTPREKQKPVGRFSSWRASSIPKENDVLACVFGGLLPFIFHPRETNGYELIGYASPNEAFAGESLLDLVTSSLLTAPSQVVDEFDVH